MVVGVGRKACKARKYVGGGGGIVIGGIEVVGLPESMRALFWLYSSWAVRGE